MVQPERTDIKQQIINLRQLEEAAHMQFTSAKNKLISIRKRIKKLENLINPPTN